MFDVSFAKLVIVGLIALIVLGPNRLPEVARTAGKWMGRLRRFVSDVREDFDREMRNAEVLELHRLKQELDETRRMIQDTSGDVLQKIGEVGTRTDTSASKLPDHPPIPSASSGDANVTASRTASTKKPRNKKSARIKKPHARSQRAKSNRNE